MSRTLIETLEAIERTPPRGPVGEGTFAAVDRLLEEYGESRLADRLFEDIPRSVPWKVVVDLFNILAWSTSDNGASMLRTCERWLREADDVRKLEIALHQEVYPFVDQAEMEKVLGCLKSIRPEVAERCREL